MVVSVSVSVGLGFGVWGCWLLCHAMFSCVVDIVSGSALEIMGLRACC